MSAQSARASRRPTRWVSLARRADIVLAVPILTACGGSTPESTPVQATPATSDNELAILTAGSAFFGVLVAVLLTEVLAARRRRREGRATLVSLLAQLTAAIAAIQNLDVGIGSPTRTSRLLEFAIVQEHVVELENRLSIDEIGRISRLLFQAATAFDDAMRFGEPPNPHLLALAAGLLERAHQMLAIEAALSEPFVWLRRPRDTWTLRKARTRLLEEDERDVQEVEAGRTP